MSQTAPGTRLHLLAVACVVAAGCVGSAPSTHYYRPAIGRLLQASAGAPHLEGVLLVPRFTADGLVGDRAIVRTDAAGLEVRPSRYHYWTAPPTEMLQEQLAGYLQAANVAATVVTAGARIRHRYVILGRINRFERVSGRGGHRVVIELRLTLSDDGAGRVLWTDTYLSEATPADETVPAAVESFSHALDDVFARFTGDVIAVHAAP